nr:hypothetical protein [Haladaptatus sp. R4]
MSRANRMNTPEYRWAYESSADGIPGVTFPDWLALTIQFVLFEGLMLLLAWRYDLWHAVPAGTAAIVVATAGSALMLLIGRRVRDLTIPMVYRKLLFGSSIEVVLGVLAYVALVTYLLVYTPRTGAPLLESLLADVAPDSGRVSHPARPLGRVLPNRHRVVGERHRLLGLREVSERVGDAPRPPACRCGRHRLRRIATRSGPVRLGLRPAGARPGRTRRRRLLRLRERDFHPHSPLNYLTDDGVIRW